MTEKARWKRLYQAAESYRKLAPWDWVYDDQIFGVQDPETGDINYCGVLGALGEVFALVVYEGAKGLKGCLTLRSDQPDNDAAFSHITEHQHVLMASFEDRRDLEPRDLKQIRSLGVACRGRNAWKP